MNRYDAYQTKMLKLRHIRDVLYRFRILILSVIALIMAVATTLISIKGVVIHAEKAQLQYTYGDTIDLSGEAIFSDVAFEYRDIKGSNWSSDVPKYVGNYQCRYVSNSAIGYKYSDIFVFKIVPKKIEFKIIDQEVTYGEELRITHDELCFRDSLASYKTILKYNSLTNNEALVDKNSIKIQDPNGKDLTYCYEIITPIYKCDVSPRQLDITFFGGQKEFDGEALTNEEYSITYGSLAKGDRIVVGKAASISHIGSVYNNRDITIYNTKNENVTKLYKIKADAKELVVTKRHLDISSSSLTKVYDGLWYFPRYTINSGTLLPTHKLDISYIKDSYLTAGDFINEFSVHVVDRYDHPVDNLYDIKLTFGEINIQRRVLQIKTNTKEKVYDDKVLSDTSFEVINGSIAETDTVKAIKETFSSIIDVGEVNNIVSYKIYNDSLDVTDSYDFSVEYGNLKITPRIIDVNITPLTKVYDGTPLKGDQYSINGTLCDNHKEIVRNYSELTKVGKIDNELFEIDIYDYYEKFKTYNYQINYTGRENALEITQRPLSIQINSIEDIYNGNVISNETYKIMNNTSLAQGDRIVATYRDDTIDAGEYENHFVTFKILNSLDEDVTYCYKLDIKSGLIKIDKREIIINSATFKKIYDGNPFDEHCTLYSDNLPLGHRIDARLYFSSDYNDAGTYPLTVDTDSLKVFDINGYEVTKNYRIILPSTGFKLIIQQREVSIQPDEISKVYDHRPLLPESWSLIDGTLLKGHELTCLLGSERKVILPEDSGLHSICYNPKVYDTINNRDVTKNYNINCVNGMLLIQYKAIEISTLDVEKVYDGKPISNYQRAVITKNNILTERGHTITYTNWSVAPVNVKESKENSCEALIRDEHGVDITRYYKIFYKFGKLKVLPRKIGVHVDNINTTYDGRSYHSGVDVFKEVTDISKPFHIVNGQMVEGDKLYCKGLIDAYLPGKYSITLDSEIYHNGVLVDSKNYQVSINKESLVINKVHLIVATANGRKVYDGNPFEKNVWIASGDLVPGHHFEWELNDFTEINEDGYLNTFTKFVIYDDKGQDVTSLIYDIYYDYGKIYIIPPLNLDPVE